MGVAVRRYIDILIYNNYYFSLLHLPLVLALFWQQHPYFLVHFKNVFSFFNIYYERYIP